MVHKEVITLAKTLRTLTPEWKPDTQTESVFLKEVIRYSNGQLNKLMQEGSNSYGFRRQNSEKSLRLSKKNPLFRKAMSILTLCLSQIDEINNTFDDFSIDEYGNKQLQMDKMFPKFITFFDRIEKLRTSTDAKELMEAFHL